ncbi:hypothetical protein [uncultured Pseudacidovorax sp.]|uniref:hypothetical protein n=1 Tax=uncultured Pseudacidovorax sp. TaxID=679313 RepID=UPI0025D24412|nr:hypothetical protein [uncultured Pseudacidovorax sp.]
MAEADTAREQAHRLLELWSALALRHVALGGACACGAGGVSLRLEDFELDIADYLQDGGERHEDADVAGWFKARAGQPPGSQPLRDLLDGVLSGAVPTAAADWVLPRLERTLRSFAELHGGL